MKKKKTLSTQLTLVISFIVLLIVGVFWMANNTLLEKYYVFNKEKEMLAVYKMVDLAAKNDKLSDDTFAVAFEKKCVGANIDAVVFNKYGKVIIEGTTDNQEIFQLLLEASMSSYSADYNNLNMTRQKDKRLGTEYIIINNRLIDGNFVYMKTHNAGHFLQGIYSCHNPLSLTMPDIPLPLDSHLQLPEQTR